MRPHPEYLNDPLAAKHLIDEAVMDVDAAGERTSQIAGQLFERPRGSNGSSRRMGVD